MRKLGMRGCVFVLASLASGMGIGYGQVPFLRFQEAGVTAHPGETFSINLELVVGAAVNDSNGDPIFNGRVIAVDWWLGTSLSGKSLIRVDSRTVENGFVPPLGGPTFPQLLEFENPHDGSQYINASNLGATIDGGDPVTAGTHWISLVTITLDPAIPLGAYPLFTTRTDGQGWGDDQFNTGPMASQASLTVTVVPEPEMSLALAGLALLGFAAVRRYRRDRHNG